jgi:hypothetical protein
MTIRPEQLRATQQPEPQPAQPNWAPGSMEWQAEQNKSRLNRRAHSGAHLSPVTTTMAPRTEPTVTRNRKFESISLQQRVNKLSVPLEMTLVEGAVRCRRWPVR